MSPVKYSLAFFLGVFLQSLFVGLFIPLLIVAGYAQWKSVSSGRRINLVMAFATAFFGLSIVFHWILGVRLAIWAALYQPPGVTVDQYLSSPYSVDEISRRAIFQFQIVVADMVMVYRMYHIYNKSLLACVIPSISTAALAAVGGGLINQLLNLNTPADSTVLNTWSTACFCVTLFNNIFMSVGISIRLWRVHREITVYDSNTKHSVVLRAMRVLIESAALWTFFVLVTFFAFLAKSNLRYTFLDMTSPAVGLSFCLIIVRLGTMAPEVREDSWEGSQRSRVSRMLPGSGLGLAGLPMSVNRIKVEHEVFVSESESGFAELRVTSPMTPGGLQSPIH